MSDYEIIFAFPTEPRYNRVGETQHFYSGHYGMTLRDWFAGKALEGIMSNEETMRQAVPLTNKMDDVEALCKVNAALSYAYADAMLKERAK